MTPGGKRIIEEAYERHAANNYDSPEGQVAMYARIALNENERLKAELAARPDDAAARGEEGPTIHTGRDFTE